MSGSENEGSNKRAAGNDVHEETNIYEDEINLIDYFQVLWRRKWFIFLASVLPALIVGLAMFLGPRNYEISYTYNIGLGKKVFKVLEDKFYSSENLEKLVERLQKSGFDKYAEKLAEAKTAEDLKKLVSFKISPSYFEVIKPSGAKDVEQPQRIQQVQGTLLIMCVRAKSEKNIWQISSVCRKNFEQVIPLCSVREELNGEIINLKAKMAAIEETKYTLNMQLEREKSTLEKLKNLGSEGLGKLPSDIVLQFNNVGASSAYLPLPYQIQAAETQIINLEEQIRANKEMYTYYTDLLNLNEKLFGYVKKVMLSYSTLEQFHSFLTATLAEYKEQHLLDYLKAYIKRIENKVASVMPLVEKPKVYPIAKGTVKKSAIVFAIALMLSIFAAFLLEGLKKSRAQAS